MKTLRLEEIREMKANEIIERLESKQYSLLESLGANKLRKEMKPVGIICHVVMWLITLASALGEKTKKEVASNWLDHFAHAIVADKPDNTNGGVVLGFNHPSLGEIPRLIGLCFKFYPDKSYLFLVNLPWYECLMSSKKRLERLGVILTPMITPSTEKKIEKLVENDKEVMGVVGKIKSRFEKRYLDLCKGQIEDRGVVVIAPSATRQATIFKTKGQYEGTEKILPTMAILARRILGKVSHCEFVPITVKKPRGTGTGLNLFKPYRLIFHKSFSPYEAKELGRDFDREFLKRIALSADKSEIYP